MLTNTSPLSTWAVSVFTESCTPHLGGTQNNHILKAVWIMMVAVHGLEGKKTCFVRRLARKKKIMGREAFSDYVQLQKE